MKSVIMHLNNSKKDKKYNSIDLTKFLMSFLIIAIHTDPLITYNTNANYILVNIIARLAVPFFFITSGFFFSKYNEWYSQKHYLKRILKLYISWLLIYLPFDLYSLYENGNSSFKNIIIYMRECLFNNTPVAWQLWYLPSLIVSLIFLCYLCHKGISYKKIYIISIIFYLFGLMGNSYYVIFVKIPFIRHILYYYLKVFVTTRNGLFFGLAFVTIGFIFAKDNKIRNKQMINFFLFFSVLALFFEVTMLKKVFGPLVFNDTLLFLIPISYLFFYKIINIDLTDSNIYIYFKKLSTLIFCSHMLFRKIYYLLLNMMLIKEDNSLLRFFFVSIFSLIFSLVIIKLEKIKYFSWLKNLH